MSFTFQLIMELIYLIILGSAFAYGACKLFKKGKPLYFQLYVIACGCRLIERLIVFATFICGLSDKNVSVGTFLGTFSIGLFGFAANYGTLDDLVDDRSDNRNKKARRLALIVPVLLTAAALWICAAYATNISVFTGVVLFIAFAPLLASSYYCMKHLLLPKDEFGLLDATRPCNAIVVVMYCIGIVRNILASTLLSEVALACVSVGIFLLHALLVYFAVKGAEKWKI